MSLTDEIATDPLGRGYAGMTNVQVADSLNNTIDRVVTKEFLTGSEVFNVTDDVEYAALTEAQKTAWDALCAIDLIDTSNGVAKAREAELFGVATTTRSNLQTAKQSTVSRAQELGFGQVDEGDVKQARA